MDTNPYAPAPEPALLEPMPGPRVFPAKDATSIRRLAGSLGLVGKGWAFLFFVPFLNRSRSITDQSLWSLLVIAVTVVPLVLMGICLAMAGSSFHRSVGSNCVDEAAFLRGITLLKFVFILSAIGSLGYAVATFTPGVLDSSGGRRSHSTSFVSREARP